MFMRDLHIREKFCEICGEPARYQREGVCYCKKHYLQMYRHGKIIERTIFDPNERKNLEDYAICITYNKQGIANGVVKVDLNKVDELKQHKIYLRKHSDTGKIYACITVRGRKFLLHRYILNIQESEYTLRNQVDHINGDSLDNRISNLRICTNKQNMQNIRKRGKITGVEKGPNKNNKWVARIMSNYKSIHLGTFETYEEAVLARLIKERELCGEFGPNKDFYYIISHPSPIQELKRVLQTESNRIG